MDKGEGVQMRKALLLVFTLAAVMTLSACMGYLVNRAQNAQDGLIEAKFDVYSQTPGENGGVCYLKIQNTLTEPQYVKITIVEDPEVWKIFEIPAVDIVELQLGGVDYVLQLVDQDTGEVTSNKFPVSEGQYNVAISYGTGLPFDIYIPTTD
jgi:hypothetical protein